MLRILICCLMLTISHSPIFSLEKSCVMDRSTQGSLIIDSSHPEQQVIVESYSLENVSDQAIHGHFLSINSNREIQKKNLCKQLVEKNNLWTWWKLHHPTVEKNGAYSSLLGSTLQIPSREVPTHGTCLREFFFDDKWHLIDHKQNLVYLGLDNHTVAGYEDIADEPFLALRTKTTGLEGSYNFASACSNFAYLNLFPQEFDCFKDTELAMNWTDHSFDLYPHENILYRADGTIEQTILIDQRIHQSELMHVRSGFPITQLVNLSGAAVTLEKENFLLEPNQTYDFDDPLFVVDLKPSEPTGKILLISKGNTLSKWQVGSNSFDLCMEKNPGAAQLTLHYQLIQSSPISIPVKVANTNHHFDHKKPTFELESIETLPEKIWWQISSNKNFEFLIPNFQGIQDFTNTIELDACTDTFFNPREAYYFRIKGLQNGKWSDWSPVFDFTVSKPESIKNPVFQKLACNQYQISWDPAQESDTQYLIFASNAYDFMPSIYASQQYDSMDSTESIYENVNNLIATTSECSIKIGTEYAFYRIVAEQQGQYSIPSPIIRVYDYGLSIPRSLLQATQSTSNEYHVERTAFPPAYPHLNEQSHFLGKSYAFDIEHLRKGYYVPSSHVEPIVWNYLQPFFLPENHPVKPKLDRLFSKRVTQNSETLRKAGFTKPDPMKFSKTIVSQNKHVPGYIFKFFCDDQKSISDWQRLFYRVTGAIYIQDALNRYNINHLFVVPTKWIYPLPENPSPPSNLERKNFILVENVFDIYLGKENNNMWKSPLVNPVNLTWIYLLLQELGLNDSPYNFNMPMTKDNRIAFIDTEHHHKWPVPFYKLWPFLSSEMGDFWNRICNKGGP